MSAANKSRKVRSNDHLKERKGKTGKQGQENKKDNLDLILGSPCSCTEYTWVAELPAYASWLHSEASAILCVTGEPNSGKFVLGAYVCEKLSNEAGDDT